MNRRLLTVALGLSTALGGVAFFADVRSLRASEEMMEEVEISAPILPRVLVLYQREGSNFPTTQAERVAHAHASALTYDFLIHDCQAAYPAIVMPGPGDPPTNDAQNATNFEQVAQCSYEKYTAKPYWIPALVDTVDICGQELGSTWRLPNEDDVASLSQDDRAKLAAALSTPHAPRSTLASAWSTRTKLPGYSSLNSIITAPPAGINVVCNPSAGAVTKSPSR